MSAPRLSKRAAKRPERYLSTEPPSPVPPAESIQIASKSEESALRAMADAKRDGDADGQSDILGDSSVESSDDEENDNAEENRILSRDGWDISNRPIAVPLPLKRRRAQSAPAASNLCALALFQCYLSLATMIRFALWTNISQCRSGADVRV